MKTKKLELKTSTQALKSFCQRMLSREGVSRPLQQP